MDLLLGVTGLFLFALDFVVTKDWERKRIPAVCLLGFTLGFRLTRHLHSTRAHSTSRANEDKVAVPIQLKKMARLILSALFAAANGSHDFCGGKWDEVWERGE